MAAAWGRAWRWRWRSKFSSTAHGGNTRGGGRWLQKPTAGGGTAASGSGTATTCGTSSTTGTTISGSAPVVGDFHPLVILEPLAPTDEEERVKKLEHIKALVGDDDSAPERWLSELEVSWVLQLGQVGESKRSFVSGQLLYLARSWSMALFKITESISTFDDGWCISKDAYPSEFVRFVRATLSKMLPFIDAIVAVRSCLPNDMRHGGGAAEPADEKLQALMLLRDALSTASMVEVLPSFREVLSSELLMAKLEEAIRDTMKETSADFLTSWGWAAPSRSPDIHPTTRSFVRYIKVLLDNSGSVNHILHDAYLRGQFVPGNENASHLTSLTMEMFRSLEEKLAANSQSFPDQSLVFLFLINNFQFILQQLWTLGFPPESDLAGKIDDYVNSYIQVSGAPVLKCLHNPTPHCFPRRLPSPLPKFESKFHETYNTQKLCKVPDPAMRKRLREAIIQKVIPGFTILKDKNTNRTLGMTPHEMEMMLQELFEG